MRLRFKTLIVVALAMTVIFSVLFLAASYAIAWYFESFENRLAGDDIVRVRNALDQDVRRIDQVASDWAVRNDTYRFMQTRDSDIIDSEVGPESLANLDAHMVLFMDKSWRPIRAEFADLDLMIAAEPDAATLQAVISASELNSPGDPRWRRSGLLVVGDRTMLVAAHAITTSDMYTPPNGTIVFGRYLDQAQVDRLSEVTKLDVKAFPLTSGAIPADVGAAFQGMESSGASLATTFTALSEQTLGAYTVMSAVDGSPAVMLRAAIDREVHQQGQRGIRYLGIFMVITGLAATASVYVVMDRGVLARLSSLSTQVALIGENEDVTGRVSIPGTDELSELAAGINGMLVAIERSEQQLKDARDDLEVRVRSRTEQLLASETRYRHLIDQMADAVFAVGLDGSIQLANERAVEMCGLTAASLLGVPLPSLMSESSAEEVQRHVARRHRSNSVWTIEASIGRADGDAIPVELRASPMIDESGELVGTQWIARDIAERKVFEQELVRLASHDHLTGLHNRRYFESELDSALARARQTGGRGAILWLDLDDFKDINDSLGHRAGDEVLLELGGVLRRQVRESTVLARLGGDEFALLVPDATAEEAELIAGRMLSAINSYTYIVDGHPIRLSASMGLVTYPEHGTVLEELLAKADAAMYAAKVSGLSSVSVHPFDEAGRSERVTRARWNEQITSALENDRFETFAQPMLDVHTGTIVRYELLARMRSESGDLVAPSEFLPTAERTGQIHDIDRMMVNRAVEILGRHPDAPFGLEVNLSGKAFGDTALLPLIAELLHRSRIDPGRIGFEITETAAIADVVRAQQFIGTLKDLGCRFSLDDFGSGFSSFYYLKHLPVDLLKVDGSFIRGLADDEQDQHLVRGMTEMCRGLGVSIAAEYVETPEIMDVVAALGIDYAQGFHIGQPLPVDEAIAAHAVASASGEDG